MKKISMAILAVLVGGPSFAATTFEVSCGGFGVDSSGRRQSVIVHTDSTRTQLEIAIYPVTRKRLSSDTKEYSIERSYNRPEDTHIDAKIQLATTDSSYRATLRIEREGSMLNGIYDSELTLVSQGTRPSPAKTYRLSCGVKTIPSGRIE